MEIWKDIDGYRGLYQVSDLGRIKSLYFQREKILSPGKQKKGYLYVSLTRQSKQRSYLVARLVAIAFIDNPDNLPQINHKSGIKTDNRVDNLEWVSNKANMVHAYQVLGRKGQLGVINGRAKLTQKDVVQIRDEYFNHHTKQKDLAKKFGVIQCHISRIVRHTAWDHMS